MSDDVVELAYKLRKDFWTRHRNADYLVCTKDGDVIGAIYYGPDYYNQLEVQEQEMRRFFSAVQDLTFRKPPQATP